MTEVIKPPVGWLKCPDILAYLSTHHHVDARAPRTLLLSLKSFSWLGPPWLSLVWGCPGQEYQIWGIILLNLSGQGKVQAASNM